MKKDKVLENALSQRAALVNRVAEIDRFIKMHKSFSDDAKGAKKGPSGQNSPTQKILDTVTEILSKESPLKPAEILSRLAEHGISIAGTNPANNLSAKLSGAKDRFRSLGRGQGWTLK